MRPSAESRTRVRAGPAVDQYWSRRQDDLVAVLGSTPGGLSNAEAEERLQRFGRNALRSRQRATPLQLFLRQFTSPIVLILLFATVVSALTQEWVDAVLILAIVLGSAALSFSQEHRANAAAERLRAQITVKATVLRDGQPQSIPATDVVPGDVILLSAGSLIPADAVLLDATDFYVNQAVLTGETFPVPKAPEPTPVQSSLAERANCVYMGTNVRSGSARALVVETGQSTAFGQIAERLTQREPETGFEQGIRRFGYLLSEVMLALVLAVFAINVFFQEPVLESLLFSVALAVGLTPQLLPAIVSVNLSRGSQAMAAHGVIVRRLESIENLGSMDTLCTDKTGTLTEGVVQLDGALDPSGQPSDEALLYAHLNARFQTGLANPLDTAVLAAAQPDIGQYSKIDELPYDFVRKRMSVVVERRGERLLIAKGALENVLAVCTQMRDGTAAAALDEAHRRSIGRRFEEWSAQGYRVLGVALREIPVLPRYSRADEQELVFLGFLLFFDPPKSGVQETIARLAALGVQLKIITGDNRLVAEHTAASIGLQVTGTVSGKELNDTGDEALWHSVRRANLFVEVDPNQKERIILALQKRGHVVGYLGDGINDAPALHSADIGISVDGAVDVAKEAADLVLQEHDLAVLNQGILLGRTTFANTLKYIFITTSANFGNMFSMAGASLLLPFLPMLPVQILLTNFLTDLPAMNIAGDSVDAEAIERPRSWDIRFIRRFMVTFGLVSSAFDYVTFAALLLLAGAGSDQFRSGWFLESVLTELLMLMVIRTRRPFFKSRPGRGLIVSAAAVALATLVLPYSPLGRLAGLVPLPLSLVAILVAIALAYMTCSEAVKRAFYRRADE